MTAVLQAQLQPRWALGMYNARFVQKTSPDQQYADFCDQECKDWFGGEVPDFLQDMGGWWSYPTKNGW